MNLKFSISTAVCALFFLSAAAQTFTPVNPDKLELVLMVNDIRDGNSIEPSYTIAAERLQEIVKYRPLKLKFVLNYNSEKDTIAYFRIDYKIMAASRLISDPLNNGVTVPVIIPPIRKDSTRIPFLNNVHSNIPCMQLNTYPHIMETNFLPVEDFYTMKVRLYRYDSLEDYCSGSLRQLVSTEILTFSTLAEIPVPTQNQRFVLHPNPSSDYVIIQETTESIPHKNPGQKSSVLIIYNMKGIEVSRHKLSDQPISIRHLLKGIYYCHIKNGNRTIVKTLIKN